MRSLNMIAPSRGMAAYHKKLGVKSQDKQTRRVFYVRGASYP